MCPGIPVPCACAVCPGAALLLYLLHWCLLGGGALGWGCVVWGVVWVCLWWWGVVWVGCGGGYWGWGLCGGVGVGSVSSCHRLLVLTLKMGVVGWGLVV